MPVGINPFSKVTFSITQVIFSSYICWRQEGIVDKLIDDGLKQLRFKPPLCYLPN